MGNILDKSQPIATCLEPQRNLLQSYVANRPLYKPLFWLVHWSVGPSCSEKPHRKGDFTFITAPAHLYATDAVMYTAGFVLK